MEILLAKDMGFCWGVRRAIDIMEKAADEKGEIISLGPIVHNPQVVRELEERGVRTAGDLSDGDSLPVAITAHGVGPDVLEDARSRGNEVIDTTCPIVTRSQRWAKKMAEAGFTVVIFGDPNHREVRGVLAWAGANAIAIQDGDPLPADLPSRLAVISQTTQSPERFAEFVSRLMQEHVGKISELRVINTLCDVTSSQQAAARELAQEVDLVLVVGGRSSANTRHLLDVCKEEGSVAYHVEGPDELKAEWLKGCKSVGVTAGASTPDSAVEAVVRRVQRLGAGLEGAASRG
ncbi:MAG: 4-hydroxy-3-methylbut-2-enyl diphosphate reductase [Dehalococcoidia bacterium]|nr:4-hydroxy-3-methylbut-2-enyl diphosphate reductase [Dehalococcoidia bacterium]